MGLWAHRRIGVSVSVGVGMGVSVGVGVSKGVDASGGEEAVSKHPTSHSPQLSSTLTSRRNEFFSRRSDKSTHGTAAGSDSTSGSIAGSATPSTGRAGGGSPRAEFTAEGALSEPPTALPALFFFLSVSWQRYRRGLGWMESGWVDVAY